MYSPITHRMRPTREARTVLLCVVTLLLALGLVASKVPPAVVLGLVTWAVLALCFNSCDFSELAGRLLHVTSKLEDAERNLAVVRAERDRLALELAANKGQPVGPTHDSHPAERGRRKPGRKTGTRPCLCGLRPKTQWLFPRRPRP